MANGEHGPYEDRRAAGRHLAQRLSPYVADSPVVLSVSRSGVPVAFEVAIYLGAPLDLFLVRKVALPGFEELPLGAIVSGGLLVLNEELMSEQGLTQEEIEPLARREAVRLAREETAYGVERRIDPRNRILILVDDGLSTGATMRAAVAALRAQHPAKIVVAVPIASPEACHDLGEDADDIVCAHTPAEIFSVGTWYTQFPEVSDAEVRTLLAHAATATPMHASP